MSLVILILLCNLSWIEASTDAEIRSEMLRCHNDARAIVGIDDLEWSSSIAKIAQREADRCIGCHKDKGCKVDSNKPSGYGENLAWMSGSKSADADVWYSRCMAWVKEKKYWTYGTKSGTEKCSKQCGHYTQIVWENTKKFGCGWKDTCKYAVTSSGKKMTKVLVCHYSPAGNVDTQYAYPKGGSSSNSGTEEEDNSGSSGSDKCVDVDIKGIRSSVEGIYSKQSTESYKKVSGTKYYLYKKQSYWTISTTNGAANWKKGKCGPSVSDVTKCSGKWEGKASYSDLTIKSASCNGAFELSGGCLRDTEYASSLCVNDMVFTPSQTECINDKALYYHEYDSDMVFIYWYSYGIYSNTTDEGDGAWVLNDDIQDNLGDAWCGEEDLMDCINGKWYKDVYSDDGVVSVIDADMIVFKGKCDVEEVLVGWFYWVILVILVIFVLFGVFAAVMCYRWKRQEIPKEMVPDMEELEEDEEEEEIEVEVEKLVETEKEITA